MAKPLVLDLHIPYCIRPENSLAHFNAVGSNAEKNAYMDALKREVLSYEGELDGYALRAGHRSGGSASAQAVAPRAVDLGANAALAAERGSEGSVLRKCARNPKA